MNYKIVLLLTLLIANFTMNSQSENKSIEVTVTNIASDKGKIVIGLYQNPDNFLKEPFKGLKIDAKKGVITAIFEDVAPGEYAISLFHDKNNNGKLDTNFIGIPKEPYAASNNAKNAFGPPKWEDAKFTVSDTKTLQKINL